VHGSWLNQAEIEISVMAAQCLGKRRMGMERGASLESTHQPRAIKNQLDFRSANRSPQVQIQGIFQTVEDRGIK
jgi:hypothetical protein